MANYYIYALILGICPCGLQASLPENAPATSFVAEFGNKSAIAVWKSAQDDKQLIQAAAYNGQKWSTPLTVFSSDKNVADPIVAVNKKGQIVFLWSVINDEDFCIQACVFDGTGLSTPVNISQPEQKAQQPKLSVEEDGKFIATWSVGEGKTQSAAFDGISWTKPDLPPTKIELADTPEEVPSDPVPPPQMATTPPDAPEETEQSKQQTEDQSEEQPQEELTIAPTEECEEEFLCCPGRDDCGVVLFGNVSYFRPNSGLLRQVYNNAWAKYDVMLLHPIWKSIYATEIVGYTGSTGHSLGGHQRTHIHIVPLSIGINYLYAYEDFDFYIGLGPRYFFLNIHNYSDFVKKHDHKNGLGGFASLGANYHYCNFVIDFFAEYSYKRFGFHKDRKGVQRESLQVGGLSIGAGLGYQF